MRITGGLALVAAVAVAAPAAAQGYRCAVPQRIERPRPDLPSVSQPKRDVPIGGYKLALSWTPQFCHDNTRRPTARFQCASGNRFGFTLHGLWPDGVGKEWPQYCRATGLVPPAVIRRMLCTTPSVQLIQHEWAKHGTCMTTRPSDYFDKAAGLYARLRYPDMDALSRAPLTATRLAEAVAAANPGLPATAVLVTTNRRGWLNELWLCLDKQFAYVRCRTGSGGVAGNAAVKIWRGPR